MTASQSHVDDTLVAGAGLCVLDATRFVVDHAPESIAWLQGLGVPFSQESGHLHLTREGGHSQARRIVHVTDATGAAVQGTQIATPCACCRPTSRLFEQPHAGGLGHRTQARPGRILRADRCLGLYALDSVTDEVLTFRAPHTILATGGAGKVYLYTTNPDTATGDGTAAAWRAGCSVVNMEFIQFHPTCLYHPQAKSFLITEAVRGEGGRLLLPRRRRASCKNIDARGELAPRDVVARAIDFEMKKGGFDCVLPGHLATRAQGAFCWSTFCNILRAAACELGIDMAQAAHSRGAGGPLHLRRHQERPGRPHRPAPDCTPLVKPPAPACTAPTGWPATRWWSAWCLRRPPRKPSKHDAARTSDLRIPAWDHSRVTDADEVVVISHNWDELRRFMWDYVGIVRTNKRLERAAHRIALLTHEIDEFYGQFRVTQDLLELRNLVQVAELIVRSAQARRESRGLHFSRDYPALKEPRCAHHPPVPASHHRFVAS